MADEPSEAQRLPAGHHGIPAELVARNQWERLIAAMAEACAEKGYAEVAVADVVARANVSTATFYKRFDSKRDCLLSAHTEFLGRLLEEVDAACAGAEGEEGIQAAIGTCLELLAADPPTARLLLVEILGLGPEGAERHAAMVGAFAERLRAARGPRQDQGSPQGDWAIVAGAAALVARSVMAGEGRKLPDLKDELTRILAPSPG